MVAANLALIGLWAVSRTVGLPLVGDHAGHAATVSLVDGATVAFEAAAVLVAVALLRRPGLGARTGGAAALAVPLVVMALTSAVVASPSARDHAAGSHGEHAAGAHDDAAMAGGHAHGDGAAVPEDDRGWSLLTNGHDHGATELVELDDATQATLDDELAVTGELVARYPTAAEAMAAGYRRAGPFTPGLGTHYVGGPMKMVSGTMDRDELLSPVLIFDGPGAEAPLAGFMYLSIGTQTPPEGFAGPNDHWHYHENVCLIPRADGGARHALRRRRDRGHRVDVHRDRRPLAPGGPEHGPRVDGPRLRAPRQRVRRPQPGHHLPGRQLLQARLAGVGNEADPLRQPLIRRTPPVLWVPPDGGP